MSVENPETENNNSKENQSSSVTSSPNEAPYLSFLERILTPVFSMRVNNSEPDTKETNPSADEVTALKTQLDELKTQLANQSKDTQEESKDTQEESNDTEEESSETAIDTQSATPSTSFPSPASASSETTKSPRDEYLELAQSSPRRAALYFKEHGSKILSDVRFFE